MSSDLSDSDNDYKVNLSLSVDINTNCRILSSRMMQIIIGMVISMVITVTTSLNQVDSDNDSPDYKEQFIESGIFEEEEMEIKMELEKELEVKRMVTKTKKEVLREAKGTQTLEVDYLNDWNEIQIQIQIQIQVDQQISQLNEEIVKLTQIRSLVEQRVSPSTKDPSEASEAGSKAPEYQSGGGVVATSPLSKVSEYGSCEELEMINGAGR